MALVMGVGDPPAMGMAGLRDTTGWQVYPSLPDPGDPGYPTWSEDSGGTVISLAVADETFAANQGFLPGMLALFTPVAPGVCNWNFTMTVGGVVMVGSGVIEVVAGDPLALNVEVYAQQSATPPAEWNTIPPAWSATP